MRRLLVALTLALVWPASAFALPDLQIELPSGPGASVAPVYVDSFQEPGRVLYRFDALIRNSGDTLDLYRDDAGVVRQALWEQAEPGAVQDPEEAPAAPSQALGGGARMEFVVEETHQHFHFFTAARYELLVPGAAPRVSEKIGFCLFDSFDTDGVSLWFPADADWCHESSDGVVRMGLSPGAADRYSAQREFQYVDVTGLTPGTYTLRGVANPSGQILERDGAPDEHSEPRAIPGVVASSSRATTRTGEPVAIPLPARSTATGIPGRARASCRPSQGSRTCYAWAGADGPFTFRTAAPPAHGSVAYDRAGATYTPAPGFTGTDSFAFTATDVRGLTSATVPVTVEVAPPPPVVAGPASGPRRLLKILRARRAGHRTLAVRVLCRPRALGACSGRLSVRLGGRTRGARALAPLASARRRTLRIRLSRPLGRRSTVVVLGRVRDDRGRGVTARRLVRARDGRGVTARRLVRAR